MSNFVFYNEMTEQLEQALDVLPFYDALSTIESYFNKQIKDGNAGPLITIRDTIRQIREEHLAIVIPGYRTAREPGIKPE